MFRRLLRWIVDNARRAPATTALVVLCVVWTVGARILGLGYAEAGALTGRRLWLGGYWRLLTAMLLHHMESWIHLVVNGLSLFFVGRVIERACGRRVFLAALVGAALAGFASSLVFAPNPYTHRVGISGGIAGLLGLLLAVEWCVTRSFREFLGQRNTILILVFLAASIPFALLVELGLDGDVRVDHAGHAGGFLFGLLAGLAYYTRRGPRLVRGAIAALALSLLPVAYAAHPLLDAQYQLWRGDRAYLARDFAGAAAAYERALRLDPGNPHAGLRLAELKDDPRHLEGLRDVDDGALLAAYLELAARRLGTDPGTARSLADRAAALSAQARRERTAHEAAPLADPWQRFAAAARSREIWEEAYRAWRQAAALLQPSEAWRPHAQALQLGRRLARPTGLGETIQLARGAAMGFAEKGLAPDARDALEGEIAAAAHAASVEALEAAPAAEVAGELAGLFKTLAENTGREKRKPGYRVRSAFWFWRQVEAPEPDPARFAEVQARFRAALGEAREHGDGEAERIATAWFRERGLPVPEPDLEGQEGGG